MNKSIKYIFLLLLLNFLFSCTLKQDNNEVTMSTIDSIINKYDKIDYSCFKGFHIIYRENRFYNKAIFITPADSNQQWYFGANINLFGAIKISGDSIFEMKLKNKEFNMKNIKRIFEEFSNLGLLYLKVKNDGNVFLSPYSFERPLLLRINTSIYPNRNDKIQFESGDGHYTHIKDNWYLHD